MSKSVIMDLGIQPSFPFPVPTPAPVVTGGVLADTTPVVTVATSLDDTILVIDPSVELTS